MKGRKGRSRRGKDQDREPQPNCATVTVSGNVVCVSSNSSSLEKVEEDLELQPPVDTSSSPEQISDTGVAISNAYVVGATAARPSQVLDALKVEREVSGDDMKKRQRRYIILLVAWLVSLVVVIAVTVSLLNQSREDPAPVVLAETGSPTPAPSAGPSFSPTFSPTTYLEGTGGTYPPTSDRFSDIVREVMAQFDSPTLEVDLIRPSSPQYKAALWMAEMDVHDATADLEFPLNNTDITSILQFRQRYALVTFYYSTNGEEWVDRCNFLDPALHVCEWRCPWDVSNPDIASFVSTGSFGADSMGVTCFPDFVAMFEMGYNNLSGSIPEEIQGLDFLSFFNIRSGRIQGTLPLKALSSTLLPKQFGLDPSLSVLVVNSNLIEGTLSDDIGKFSSLVLFEVQDNLLTGSLPLSIGNLTSCVGIYLTENALSGSIPDELFQIPSLEGIGISYNLLSGTLPESSGVNSTLILLSLYDNVLTGTIPETLASAFPELSYINIGDNILSGAIPSSLSGLTALNDFYVGSNQFTGKILEESSFLYNMKSIEVLALGGNHFTGTIASEIKQLSNLLDLDVGNIVFRSENDQGFGKLLSGAIPTELALLTRLTSLAFARNELSGTIPTELGLLTSLEWLILSFNNLTGTFPTELGLLSNIATLGMSGNENVSGSLEPFCSSTRPTQVFGLNADCLLESVICSCCTDCCDGRQCRKA